MAKLGSLRERVRDWWTGGDVVIDKGSVVFFRAPRSFPQRVKKRLSAAWSGQFVPAIVSGLVVAAIAKALNLV